MSGVVFGKLFPDGLHRSALRRQVWRQPHYRLDERVVSAFVEFNAIHEMISVRSASYQSFLRFLLYILMHRHCGVTAAECSSVFYDRTRLYLCCS